MVEEEVVVRLCMLSVAGMANEHFHKKWDILLM
jgi:hypothetical protein